MVIDDAQHLAFAPEATAMLDGLARHAPPSLHLVVATRTELPFATSRLELEGQACRIDQHQLAFRPDEVAELLGPDADPALVDEVVAHTGGWAIATAFAAHAIRQFRRRRTAPLDRCSPRPPTTLCSATSPRRSPRTRRPP